MQHSTIAAIATAPGAGGIAVVRLSGPESYEVAARVFRPANPSKKVAEAKGYTAMFGAFVEGEDAFDEGVALFFRAPHSYTGEDVVELSCHGGSAVARRLVEACIAAGASPAAPGEYTRRAFLNGKLSLTQAEAVMDLISADGRQGAALANASLNGALSRKITAQKDALTALQAHLAAWVDFPEEDVPELSQSHLCAVLGGVEQELDALIQSYDAGAVLREGVDCAIVGRPERGQIHPSESAGRVRPGHRHAGGGHDPGCGGAGRSAGRCPAEPLRHRRSAPDGGRHRGRGHPPQLEEAGGGGLDPRRL